MCFGQIFLAAGRSAVYRAGSGQPESVKLFARGGGHGPLFPCLSAAGCAAVSSQIPQKQEVVPVSFPEQEFCIPPAKTAVVEEIHPDTVITVRMNGIRLDISNRAARETIANTISALQGSC